MMDKLRNFFNYIQIPFAILRIRWIQNRYKYITLNSAGRHSNQVLADLRLLQAREGYYKDSFESWGKYHPDFSYSQGEYAKHLQFMDWLFPEKDFEEIDIVIWYKPEAIAYYHNRIYKLNGDRGTLHHYEILKQIKKWKKEREKDYLKNNKNYK